MAKNNNNIFIGKKYGKLIIIDFEKHKRKTGYDCWYWLCKCECGNIKLLYPAEVKNGKIKSCGCYKDNLAKLRMSKHNQSTSRLYHCWQDMKARCYRKTHHKYLLYGNRDIRVCDEWLNNYDNFSEWALNNGYSNDLTLDRINVNGNYCPENCRWATPLQQSQNRRNTKKIIVDGVEMLLTDACKKFNISYYSVYGRLKSGWDIEKALTTKVK